MRYLASAFREEDGNGNVCVMGQQLFGVGAALRNPYECELWDVEKQESNQSHKEDEPLAIAGHHWVLFTVRCYAPWVARREL